MQEMYIPKGRRQGGTGHEGLGLRTEQDGREREHGPPCTGSPALSWYDDVQKLRCRLARQLFRTSEDARRTRIAGSETKR